MLAFILLVLLASASSTPIGDVLILDCTGTVRVLPGSPLYTAVKSPAIRVLYDSVVQTFRSRAQCHCPLLTNSTLDRAFSPTMGNLIQALTDPQRDTFLDGCQALNEDSTTTFAWDFTQWNFSTQIPATCSPSTWSTLGKCSLQAAVLPTMTLQGAFSKCPNTNLPYISVSCSGVGCEDILRPCQTSDDCAGSPCVYTWQIKDAVDSVLADLFRMVMEIQYRQGCGGEYLPDNAFARIVNVVKQLRGLAVANLDQVFPGTCGDFSQAPTIDALTAWDGALATGASAFAPDRLDGSSLPPVGSTEQYAPGVFPVVRLDCQGQGSLFAQSTLNVLFTATNLHTLVNATAASTLEFFNDLLGCQNKPHYTAIEFTDRFLPWTPALWLNLLSSTGANLGPVLPGLLTRYTRDFSSLSLPPTCSWSTLATTGYCDFEWSGFSSLLTNTDATLRFNLAQCPSAALAPWDLRVTCVGTDCASLLQPWEFNPCSQDAECNGRRCLTSTVDGGSVEDELWYFSSFQILARFQLDPSRVNEIMSMTTEQFDSLMSSFFAFFWDLNGAAFPTLATQYTAVRNMLQNTIDITFLPGPPALMNDVLSASLIFNQMVFLANHFPPTTFNWTGPNPFTTYPYNFTQLPADPSYAYAGVQWCFASAQWLDPDYCSDECDTDVAMTKDILTALRIAEGQTALPPNTQGYCQHILQTLTVDSLEQWWNNTEWTDNGFSSTLNSLTSFVPVAGENAHGDYVPYVPPTPEPSPSKSFPVVPVAVSVSAFAVLVLGAFAFRHYKQRQQAAEPLLDATGKASYTGL